MKITKTISLSIHLTASFLILNIFLSECQANVILTVGNGTGFPGLNNIQIVVSLENQSNRVAGVQLDICDVDDYLSVTECETTDRTSGFNCASYEQKNGCAGIVLYSTTCEHIDEGIGPIFTLRYSITQNAIPEECRGLDPKNAKIVDMLGNGLTVEKYSGEVCFIICGDVYPQDCYEHENCGDGSVDIYDLMEIMDIILGVQKPTKCQIIHGDVPLGKPPYCGEPGGVNPPNCETDGVIDIFDSVVIIDKAINKMNCCDYCMFGEIY